MILLLPANDTVHNKDMLCGNNRLCNTIIDQSELSIQMSCVIKKTSTPSDQSK